MATMADDGTSAGTASLKLTCEEAAVMLRALKMFRNARQYAFKGLSENRRESHTEDVKALERLETRLSELFPGRR